MTSGRPRDQFERELFPELPFLLVFAKKLAGQGAPGEDLYSEVIVKLIANKDTYVLGTNMRAWACFIMRNQFYSDRRRAWRSVEWDDDFDRTLRDKDNPATALEFKEVMTAMSFIPGEMAEAIMMIAEGLTYEEAGEEAGVEVGTIKSRVSRGRKLLERLFNA